MTRRPPEERFVALPTDDTVDWTPTTVGGKAANLYRISKTRLNVPAWFVVTTRALDAHLAAALGVASAGVLAEHEPHRLRSIVTAADMPSEVEAAIRAAYADLVAGDAIPDVAVRSSASWEDRASGAAAGMFETVLARRDPADVIRAVKHCWASLWSERARAYDLSENTAEVTMAVIVQRMVYPRAAGVLFTTAPDDPNGLSMRVAAGQGLGKTVVDGAAEMNEWAIDHATGAHLLAKPATSERSLLSSAEMSLLAAAGRSLEAEFRSPQDIEWAIADGDLHILQSRPITAGLAPLSLPSWRTPGSELWTRAGLGEWLQRPLSPLFNSFCMPQFDEAVEQIVGTRLGLARRSPTWCALNGYYFVRARPHSLGGVVAAVGRLVRQARSCLDDWHEAVVPRYVQTLETVAAGSTGAETGQGLIAQLLVARDAAAEMWGWVVLTGAVGRTVELLASATYSVLKANDDPPYPVLVAGFRNRSAEADEALWQLANDVPAGAHLQSDGAPPAALAAHLEATEEGQAWWRKLRDWHVEYGHRSFDLDIASSPLTLQDALALVQGMVTRDESPHARIDAQASARRQATRELEARARLPMRLWLRTLLPLAQRHARERENRPFELQRAWPIIHHHLRELGSRLRDHGCLATDDQVFYLTWEELREALAPRKTATPTPGEPDLALVSERRRLLRDFQSSLHPPALSQPWQRIAELARPERQNSEVLRGRPGSPGIARGPVRVVLAPEQFNTLAAGEVLVTSFTTPAWTPLLLRAAAVVTEKGNALAHAAIISREYGIPAVIGVRHATAVLATGEDVTIDGTAGTVVRSSRKREEGEGMTAQTSPGDLRQAARTAQEWLAERSKVRSLSTGHEVEVFDSGGAGEALLLVPVIAQMNFVFVPLIEALAGRLRVIVYSPHVSATHDVSIDDRCAEIGAVLDACDVPRAHLLAWSDAGAAAYAFVRTRLERCASATFVALPQRYRLPAAERLLLELVRRSPLERLTPDRVTAAFIARFLSGPRVPWRILFDETSKVDNVSGIFKHSLAPCLVGHRADDPLGVPVSVLWGEGDRLVSYADAKALATVLGVSVQVIPGGEHFPTFLEPGAVADHVERFITERQP